MDEYTKECIEGLCTRVERLEKNLLVLVKTVKELVEVVDSIGTRQEQQIHPLIKVDTDRPISNFPLSETPPSIGIGSPIVCIETEPGSDRTPFKDYHNVKTNSAS